MPQWQKPENALRRANELLEVGKKQDALDTLHDVIKARKHRTWTKVHELIMTKHLELCVELRKPHLAKDGLFQYRNMCQQVNVKSLEDVVTAFLDQAEKKADQARQASQGLVEDVAEDLDQAESPERLLLSAVSGEGAQDRADRAVLSPWLRFLWESYRQCLELLRNNVQVEQLYHKVARQAFQFCLKYQRRAEFRKLCDNLRTHVNQLQKTSHTHYAVKLSNPETLAMHQETRLTQLDVAIQMELWQEAYKSAEDVHQLMQSAKRSAKAQTLASYYERLALIFWKAGNALYHTAALFKLFQLHRDLKKSFTNEEAQHLATRVLLATLSIRWSDQVHDLARHLDMEDMHVEHQRRLASLLSWPTPPTRQLLLKELQRVNVIGLALQPAQQLYQWLENEFSPLKLAPEIQRHLNAVKALDKNEYTQYVEALQQVAALKILKQISQVYRSISLKNFLSIVPFFDVFRLERLIVAAGKKSQLQVRIDHRTGSVEFGVGEAMTFGAGESESMGASQAQLDVPVIQTMPSEHIRQYLQQLYSVLHDAVDSVDRDAVQAITEKLKNNAKVYEYHKNDHHKHTLERKKRIEQYKEMLERIKNEQEELTKQQEKKELEKRQREEQLRLAQENKDRTEAQSRRQQEDLRVKVMEDRMKRMNPNLQRLIKDLPEDEIQNMDAETLLQKQISHMEQEKRELIVKMKQQEKKWDYYVRAIHMVEIPLRDAEYKDRAVKDRQLWEEHEAERVNKEEEEHYAKLSNHQRLVRMEKDAMDYLAKVRESRATEMQRQMEAWKQTLVETREKRMQERKDERKEKRRQEWLQQKEEAERQKKEEEERKKREAEDQGRRGPPGGDDDRRKRFDDRRRQPRGETEEGGEVHGADADRWERTGPLQKEPPARRPLEEDGGGRRFAGGRRAEEGEPEGGANQDQWRRPAPLQQEDREPSRRGPAEEESGRPRFAGRRPGPPTEEEEPRESDQGPWRRVGPVEPAASAPRQPVDDRRDSRGAAGGSWRQGPPQDRAPEQELRQGGPRDGPSGPGYEERGFERRGPPGPQEEERRQPYGGGTAGAWRAAESRGPPPETDRGGERPWRGGEQRGPPDSDRGSWRGGEGRGPPPESERSGSWRDQRGPSMGLMVASQRPDGPPAEERSGSWRGGERGPPPDERSAPYRGGERGPPPEMDRSGPWRGGDRGGEQRGPADGERWGRAAPPSGQPGYEDDRRYGGGGGRRPMGGDQRRGGGGSSGGPDSGAWRRGPPSSADNEQSWRK